jgi:hypothetical protein
LRGGGLEANGSKCEEYDDDAAKNHISMFKKKVFNADEILVNVFF